MKLRQKLAMVLATAMVVTAVPVVTFAATNASFDAINVVVDQTIGYQEKDGVVSNVTTGTSVRVDFTRDYSNYNESFIVTADDAKFNKDAIEAVKPFTQDGLTVTLTYLSETSIRVNVSGTATDKNQGFDLPVILKVTGKNPVLNIQANGKVSAHTIKLTNAEISKEALSVSLPEKDHKTISVEGEGTLNDITVTENVAGELKKETKVVVELENSELEFAGGKVTVEGKNGLAGTTKEIEVSVNKDGDVATIVIPAGTFDGQGLAGSVAIKGLQVVAADKKADVATGEVTATITVNENEDIQVSGVVAEIKEFGTSLKVKEDDKLKLVAGHDTKKVTVTLEEAAAGSIDLNRPVYLTLEGGEIKSVKVKDDKAKVSYTRKDNKADEKITEVELSGLKGSTNKVNKFELEVEVTADAATNGEITLNAEGRGLEDDLSVVVGTATPVATIETKTLKLEAGVKSQKGGEIVITETAKAALKNGKTVVIDLADLAGEGVKVQDAKVEAEGMKVTSKTSGSQIIITVDRASSKEAGKITVSDIEVSVPGYVSEGGYDVKVGGTAIAKANTVDGKDATKDAIEVENFVVLGELNGSVNAVIDFTTGKATLNGKEVTLKAKPYKSAAGRTMVGVRDLAEFLGLPGDAIDFAKGMVTIFNGNEIIQVKEGSNILNNNGRNITMDEKVTIKEGRSYAPIRFIANALGLDVKFENNKAIFTK